MDRERIFLVLDNDAGTHARDLAEARLQLVVERRGALAVRAAVGLCPDLGAVAAHCGQFERRENPIDIGNRAAADESERAVEPIREAAQHVLQAVGNMHFVRRRRDIEQGAVDVEQDCAGGEVDARIGCERVALLFGFARAGLDVVSVQCRTFWQWCEACGSNWRGTNAI